MKIKSIKAFEILDSRGTPTIAALIEADDDFKEIGFVPSGASTGSREAIEKRDGGNNFNGKGVAQVIKNAEENLFPELIGMKIGSQVEFDSTLIELDGTKNKKNFGANIILSLSLAYCKLSASAEKKPLYEYIHDYFSKLFSQIDNNTYKYNDSEVTILDTGLDTMTGGRIKQAIEYIDEEEELL